MKKSTITDEQIFALIDEGVNNAEIQRKLGVKNIYPRLKKLRAQHEIRLPAAEKPTRRKIDIDSLPEVESPPSLQEHEQGKLDPFPYEPKEQVIFAGHLHTVRSVEANKLVMYENCNLRRVTVTLEDWNRDRNLVRGLNEKPPIKTTGEDIVLRRRRADEEPEGAKAPQTVFEKVAIEKSDGKPATVNQDFEDMFKPVHEPEKMAKHRPCAHFVKDCDHLLVDKCEDCSDYKDAMEIAEASEKAEPFNLDLEMDDLSDPEPFNNIDYVDEDWGAIEKQISETVLGRRGYLDKVDQLFDLMVPICRENPLLKVDVKNLAKSILDIGFAEEMKEAGA